MDIFVSSSSCGGKNILPNLTNSQEQKPYVLWPLGAGAARKNRIRSRLEKKSGAEATWKKVRSQSRSR